MSAKPAHLYYEFAGRREYCLGIGDAGATRTVMFVPPLFDEMNRTRAMLVAAMRDLSWRGVQSLLPDLPGCNESTSPIVEQTVESWRAAMATAAEQFGATHIATLRGGALLTGGIALPEWRLAPAKGASLLKTMLRTRIAADKEAGKASTADSLLAEANVAPVELAGYTLSAAMLFSLGHSEANTGEMVREVTLGDGPGAVIGSPLWLRAEPQSDQAMSVAIATDLDRWSASCSG